jgi:cell division protein FtsL
MHNIIMLIVYLLTLKYESTPSIIFMNLQKKIYKAQKKLKWLTCMNEEKIKKKNTLQEEYQIYINHYSTFGRIIKKT